MVVDVEVVEDETDIAAGIGVDQTVCLQKLLGIGGGISGREVERSIGSIIPGRFNKPDRGEIRVEEVVGGSPLDELLIGYGGDLEGEQPLQNTKFK